MIVGCCDGELRCFKIADPISDWVLKSTPTRQG
jgi:hypothetical protein